MNDALDVSSDPLTSAASQAEQGFLAMGQSLEQAIGILDRLTDRFATYIAELGGEAFSKLQSDLASDSTTRPGHDHNLVGHIHE